MDEHHHKSKDAIWFALGILVVLVFVGIFAFIFWRDSREDVVDTYQESQQAENRPQTGKLGLSIKGGESEVTKGSAVTVFIYADSYKAEASGYDAVIHYDPDQLVFDEVTSLIDTMEIFKTQDILDSGDEELMISGVKEIGKEDSYVFDNTALAEITFTATGSGPVSINLAYDGDSTIDSNLFDSTVQDILTDVEGVQLTIN